MNNNIPEPNSFLKSFKEITQIGLMFTAVGGLIISLWQIPIQLSTHRKDKVMELFLKQYEVKISEIRSGLYRDYNLSGAYEILKDKDKATLKKEYEEFMIKFSKNGKEGKDKYKNMLILANFYNGIASCVESDLCDQKTGEVLFKTEGRVFFENYYPFFCDQEIKWHDKLVESDSINFYDLKYPKNKSKRKRLL